MPGQAKRDVEWLFPFCRRRKNREPEPRNFITYLATLKSDINEFILTTVIGFETRVNDIESNQKGMNAKLERGITSRT